MRQRTSEHRFGFVLALKRMSFDTAWYRYVTSVGRSFFIPCFRPFVVFVSRRGAVFHLTQRRREAESAERFVSGALPQTPPKAAPKNLCGLCSSAPLREISLREINHYHLAHTANCYMQCPMTRTSQPAMPIAAIRRRQSISESPPLAPDL